MRCMASASGRRFPTCRICEPPRAAAAHAEIIWQMPQLDAAHALMPASRTRPPVRAAALPSLMQPALKEPRYLPTTMPAPPRPRRSEPALQLAAADLDDRGLDMHAEDVRLQARPAVDEPLAGIGVVQGRSACPGRLALDEHAHELLHGCCCLPMVCPPAQAARAPSLLPSGGAALPSPAAAGTRLLVPRCGIPGRAAGHPPISLPRPP